MAVSPNYSQSDSPETPLAGARSGEATPPAGGAWVVWAFLVLLLIAVGAVYSTGITGPFVLDDELSIGSNPSLRRLTDLGSVFWPPVTAPTSGRPILNLSYALNFACSGLGVEGYHLTNIAIHALATFVLFLLLREIFVVSRFCGRNGRHSPWLPVAISGIWALHPLLTSAVTYLAQRAESMMGLFYLATVYLFLRGTRAARPRGWYALSFLTCAAGMATKEVMVTAPAMVALLDTLLVAGSVSLVWRTRRGYYLALASTWLLLAGLMVGSRISERGIGGGHGFSWWAYALTQLEAIPTYVHLAVWPYPLIFDYDVHRGPLPVFLTVAGGVGILVAISLVVVALRRAPAAGLLGASFFVLLAPTSSVVPIGMQPIAESRMYLPLIPLVTAAVLLLSKVAGRRFGLVVFALAFALGALTRERNSLYRDPLALWSDTVAKRPGNARAQNCLGVTLLQIPDRRDAAIGSFQAALRLKPDFVEARNNLANALLATPERWPEAIRHYEAALRLDPRQAAVHNNLGSLLAMFPERLDEAIAHHREAVAIAPVSDQMHYNLGLALTRKAESGQEAMACFRRALELNPRHGDALNALGVSLMSVPGGRGEAEEAFRRAISLYPRFDRPHNNLAVLLADIPGRLEEAVLHYEKTLEINAGNNDARVNLGVALANLEGRLGEGIRHLEEAARRDPRNARVRLTLGKALLQDAGRRDEGIAQVRQATQIAPDWDEPRLLLDALHAAAGNARR